MSTRCFNHDHHHHHPLLWRWRRFLFSTLLCVCWRGSKIHPRCPSYRLVLEKGFSLIPVCDGRHCHPTLNALWRISLSHLLLRRERVPVVYEIRNLQIKKVRLSLFFLFFFLNFCHTLRSAILFLFLTSFSPTVTHVQHWMILFLIFNANVASLFPCRFVVCRETPLPVANVESIDPVYNRRPPYLSDIPNVGQNRSRQLRGPTTVSKSLKAREFVAWCCRSCCVIHPSISQSTKKNWITIHLLFISPFSFRLDIYCRECFKLNDGTPTFYSDDDDDIIIWAHTHTSDSIVRHFFICLSIGKSCTIYRRYCHCCVQSIWHARAGQAVWRKLYEKGTRWKDRSG